MHAQAQQRLQFFLGLDALGDDPGVDVSSEREQGHHQGAAGGADVDAVDEQPIDLDELRLDLGDDQHARVTGTGVIDGDAESALAQVGDHATQPGEVVDGSSLS